jgi:glycosyltransferase involved in cell wall biosynthesis
VSVAELTFWASIMAALYPYFGYPLVMWTWGSLRGGRRASAIAEPPSISMIIPVHNEAVRLARKIANTAALRYPRDRLQVIYVSDGSTDDTVTLLRASATQGIDVVDLTARGGKAAALNAGLARATNDIIVFSDASIELEPDALVRIVAPFADPAIGCVSGEDRIAEAGGEGLYGRYELWLRRLETRVHSIVGASGSFYAQRRRLCAPFDEGLAPDFSSVLRTVEQGYRAVSEESAIGRMTSVKDPRLEFERKVRTGIRGMTALFASAHLLNPFRFGAFAFALWSHKILRWMAPAFLAGALIANAALARTPVYGPVFGVQVLFYATAAVAWMGWGNVQRTLPGKIALYFAMVNVALAVSWWRYGTGVRQELWTPSHR